MQNNYKSMNHSKEKVIVMENDSTTDSYNLSNNAYQTLKQWEYNLRKSSNIYGYVLEKNKKYITYSQIIILILSTILTLVGAGNSTILTFNEVTETVSKYENFNWIVSIIVFFASFVITVITGIQKITKWDQYVADINKFIGAIDSYYAKIVSIINYPGITEEKLIQFLTTEYDTYVNIMAKSPEISLNDKKKYEKLFELNCVKLI